MHYYDFKNLSDKMIHLFIAALPEGLFFQAVNECVQNYGAYATNRAVCELHESYSSLVNRFM